MTNTDIQKISDMVEDAAATWIDADWSHEIDDIPANEICNDTCRYCDKVKREAAEAADYGRKAVRLLRAGHTTMALITIQAAASAEDNYGSCPVWGPVEDAIAELVKQ